MIRVSTFSLLPTPKLKPLCSTTKPVTKLYHHMLLASPANNATIERHVSLARAGNCFGNKCALTRTEDSASVELFHSSRSSKFFSMVSEIRSEHVETCLASFSMSMFLYQKKILFHGFCLDYRSKKKQFIDTLPQLSEI